MKLVELKRPATLALRLKLLRVNPMLLEEIADMVLDDPGAGICQPGQLADQIDVVVVILAARGPGHGAEGEGALDEDVGRLLGIIIDTRADARVCPLRLPAHGLGYVQLFRNCGVHLVEKAVVASHRTSRCKGPRRTSRRPFRALRTC